MVTVLTPEGRWYAFPQGDEWDVSQGYLSIETAPESETGKVVALFAPDHWAHVQRIDHAGQTVQQEVSD